MDGRHKSDTTLLFGAACIHPGKILNYPLLGKTIGKGMKTKMKTIKLFNF
jgi:hypothetical protein